MPFYIKKTSIFTNLPTYYKGDNKWGDQYSDRKSYTNKSEADAVVAPTTRKIGDKDVPNANGAFKNSTIVEE